MKIEVLRKGSRGIKGTYENIEHHAKDLHDLVVELEYFFSKNEFKGCFKLWAQGHNVSMLETIDGRKFMLRGLWLEGEGYVGISLAVRAARSNEIVLRHCYADKRNGVSPSDLAEMLQQMAEPNSKGSINA